MFVHHNQYAPRYSPSKIKNFITPKQLNSKGLKVASYALENTKLDCYIINNKTRYVKYNKQKYNSLFKLIKNIPSITNKKNHITLAKISNFIFKGKTFSVIENINKFKRAYRERINLENNSFDYCYQVPYRLTSCGTFNLDTISKPKIENNKLIYYVEDDKTIPYRVSLDYPFTLNSKVSYEC